MIFLGFVVVALLVGFLGFLGGYVCAVHKLPYRDRWQEALALVSIQNQEVIEYTSQATYLAGELEQLRIMHTRSEDEQVRINADLRAHLMRAEVDNEAIQLALSDRPQVEAKLIQERIERQRLETAINNLMETNNDEIKERLQRYLKGEE